MTAGFGDVMVMCMKTAGIDIGSITAKAAVLEDGDILATRVGFTGYNAEQAGRAIYDAILADLGAGAHFQDAGVRSVIDIGGQDSKVIALDGNGKVTDFVMNDKCAAGTGRFLEVMARALEVDLDSFGEFSLSAADVSRISSLCTVFAESEVISLIAKGEARANIIAGIHDAVAARVAALANRIGVRSPLMMTGGVAKNIGVVKALESRLGEIRVLPSAQVNGAIGAAVLAMQL